MTFLPPPPSVPASDQIWVADTDLLTGLLSELLTQWVSFCREHHGPEAGKPSLPPWQCLSSVHGTLVPSTRR